MPEAIKILEVKSPHFTIKLSDDLLKIDLKGSFKNEVEEALEHKPVLKESIGRILGIFVPLHIHVSEIDSVHMDETGKITVNLHHHRYIVIPLEHKENAEKLVEKLNQLISKARTEKIRENAEEKRAEKKLKRAHAEAKRKENERINAQRAHEIHEEKVFG
jgi:predicted ribosome quality control (RQC) complex YloA/Tae2 family protein